MCGLVGMFGNLRQIDRKSFSTLMILNQLRGRDSTGVAMGGNGYEPEVWKEVGGFENLVMFNDDTWDDEVWFPNLLSSKRISEYWEKGVKKTQVWNSPIMPNFIFGHGRWATKGGINADNAHPFNLKNIIGVHNGTMYDYFLSKLKTYKGSITDSQAVFETIDKIDVEDKEGLNKFLSSLGGQFAFIWYDKRDESFHFYRNDGRPLYFTERSGSTLMWASESWMLEKAISVGLYRNEKSQWSKIKSMSKLRHVIVKFDGKELVSGGIEDVPYSFQVCSSSPRWFKTYQAPVQRYYPPYNPPANTTPPLNVVTKEDKDFEVPGFNGEPMTVTQYETVAAHGCSMCCQPLPDAKDVTKDNVKWIDKSSPMCSTCDSTVKEWDARRAYNVN